MIDLRANTELGQKGWPEASEGEVWVDSVEGLLELPLQSVILLKGQPRIKRHDGMWLGTGKDSGFSAIDSTYIIYWYRSVAVLYVPDGPVNV